MAAFRFAILLFLASQSAAHARVLDAQRGQRTWDRSVVSEALDSCKDCTQILELFVDMLSNADTQEKIKEMLDEVCSRLPGTQTQNLCRDQVSKYLPMAIQFLTGFIKPGQICTLLGLCHSQSQGKELELLTNYFAEARILPGAGTMTEVQSSVQCTFCLYLIKGVESLMPNTEDAIVHFLGQGCCLLPGKMKDQCHTLVDKYVRQVMGFLLSWATPEKVCSLLQICSSQENPGTDCDACQTLEILARFHLGSNATEHQTSSFLKSVCDLHPSAIPECDTFTQRHGPTLQRILGKPGAVLDVCQGALLCARDREAGEGGHACSKGRIYTCKDMETAKECNSVSFCQEYLWK
ncbi:prosaposin-like [Megalops cyprinoides]|uniref:prosaposin-like n=1 Tax=Megalops cyprinoides TaxID=118141 RepID=UPI0018642EF2|nr:prosaposin-like [Megalops cyprinoides]